MDPFSFDFTSVDLMGWFGGIVLPPQTPTPGVADSPGSDPAPTEEDPTDNADDEPPPGVSADPTPPTPNVPEDDDLPPEDSGSDDAGESEDSDSPVVNLQPQVLEGADSVAEAQALQAPVNFSQTVGGDGDTQDFFQITAPKSGELVVSLSGMTANLDLRLYDPTGVELAGSENPGTEDDEIVYDVEEGVQYVLQVAPTTDENSPYQVTMTLNGEAGYDGDAPDDDGFVGDDEDQDGVSGPGVANDDGVIDGATDGAGNVITPGEPDDPIGNDGSGNNGGGSSISPFILTAPENFIDYVGGPEATSDYFQLTAPESGTLVVTLTGSTAADLDLTLLDAAGNELAASRNQNTLEEQITYNVEAGVQYVLGITLAEGAESPYQVNMTLNGRDGSEGGAVDGSTGDTTITSDDNGLVPGGAVSGNDGTNFDAAGNVVGGGATDAAGNPVDGTPGSDDNGLVPGGAVSGNDGTNFDAAGNVVGGGATDAAGNPVNGTPGLASTSSTSYSLAPENTAADVSVVDQSAFV